MHIENPILSKSDNISLTQPFLSDVRKTSLNNHESEDPEINISKIWLVTFLKPLSKSYFKN